MVNKESVKFFGWTIAILLVMWLLFATYAPENFNRTGRVVDSGSYDSYDYGATTTTTPDVVECSIAYGEACYGYDWAHCGLQREEPTLTGIYPAPAGNEYCADNFYAYAGDGGVYEGNYCSCFKSCGTVCGDKKAKCSVDGSEDTEGYSKEISGSGYCIYSYGDDFSCYCEDEEESVNCYEFNTEAECLDNSDPTAENPYGCAWADDKMCDGARYNVKTLNAYGGMCVINNPASSFLKNGVFGQEYKCKTGECGAECAYGDLGNCRDSRIYNQPGTFNYICEYPSGCSGSECSCQYTEDVLQGGVDNCVEFGRKSIPLEDYYCSNEGWNVEPNAVATCQAGVCGAECETDLDCGVDSGGRPNQYCDNFCTCQDYGTSQEYDQCSINSVYFANTNGNKIWFADHLQPVNLVVTSNGNCKGIVVDLQLYEEDGIAGRTSVDDLGFPTNIQLDDNEKTSILWTALYSPKYSGWDYVDTSLEYVFDASSSRDFIPYAYGTLKSNILKVGREGYDKLYPYGYGYGYGTKTTTTTTVFDPYDIYGEDDEVSTTILDKQTCSDYCLAYGYVAGGCGTEKDPARQCNEGFCDEDHAATITYTKGDGTCPVDKPYCNCLTVACCNDNTCRDDGFCAYGEDETRNPPVTTNTPEDDDSGDDGDDGPYDPPRDDGGSGDWIKIPGICIPKWQMTAWGICIDGLQTRAVFDIRNCGNDYNKPKTQQGCIPEQRPDVCVEEWDCTGWGECQTDSTQTRVCKDLNECGTYENLPVTEQPCIKSDLTWLWFLIALVISTTLTVLSWPFRKKAWWLNIVSVLLMIFTVIILSLLSADITWWMILSIFVLIFLAIAIDTEHFELPWWISIIAAVIMGIITIFFNYSTGQKLVIWGTLLLILGIYLALYFTRKKKVVTNENVLSRFITNSKKKGYTKEQIRQALIKKGWPKKLIDDALQ